MSYNAADITELDDVQHTRLRPAVNLGLDVLNTALRELVEFTLRTMLSFWVAPNDPARSRDDLRRFIRRWLGGAILAQ